MEKVMYKPVPDVKEFWIVEYQVDGQLHRRVVCLGQYEYNLYDTSDEETAFYMYFTGTDNFYTFTYKQLREQDFGKYKLIKKVELWG